MKIETVFVALAIVLVARCAIQPSSPCGKFEIYTQARGCIKSCLDPSFKKCPDAFIDIWDPKFCALQRDGTWNSYTFECQACKNTGNLGVANGMCDETETPVQFCKNDKECAEPEICLTGICFNRCKTTKCSGGNICVHGECIPEKGYCKNSGDCRKNERCVDHVCRDKCWGVKCPPGYICVNGNCEKKLQNSLDVCPASTSYNIILCKPPRPDDKTCPKVFYVRKPDPLVCGVTSTGERISYPRECEACKNKDVVYYFDKPCHQAPFVCEKNQKCLGYYCQSSCKDAEQCPFDWQTCLNGKCIDKCTLWYCASCKYGQCGYEEPYGKCTNDSECKSDRWSCVGFVCVDLCEKTSCKFNQFCNKGNCYPNKA